MAEVDVTVEVKVDGHTFVFKGDSARGPMGHRPDTVRATRQALERAVMGDNGLEAVLGRYSSNDPDISNDPRLWPPVSWLRRPPGSDFVARPQAGSDDVYLTMSGDFYEKFQTWVRNNLPNR